MKFRVYIHLNDLPGAFELMSEQLTLASETGLLEEADQVVLCTNGNPASFNAAKEILSKAEFPNVRFEHTSDRTDMWEFPTLDLMKREADAATEEFAICYFHLKGLSRLGDQRVNDWRNYMQYWTIERWEDCLKKLEEGFDLVGTNIIEQPWLHSSGNFWWSKSSYVKTLDALVYPDNLPWGQPSKYIDAVLDGGNFRYEHEAWIGSKHPAWFEIHSSPGKQTPGWHFENIYPREEYATSSTED